MLVAIGLSLFGLALIYFEFFMPGGILGLLGGVCVILGVMFAVWKQDSLVWFFFYLFGVIVLLALTIKLALWRIKKTKHKGHYYLEKDQEGYVASSYDRQLLGQVGEALTPLRPSGHVKIKDMPYQAVAESGYIRKGSKIKIVGGEGARFIVKEELE